jgi:type IV pilus assembly protein PilM
MATFNGAWGIDIGQCALKAMRCVPDGDSVKVDAFDYIEYPKILSQPDGADPQELIREAVELFLSRNEVKGYKVSMSVPGQAGLARFFKPPPVAANKIPDIVKYEAKQQIPFELEDVIWDYQQMGGAELDGIALDAEVGLFAMKKDAVHRAIGPLQAAGVELDLVQLAPLAIYNFVTYDRLDVDSIEFDPDNPPASMVVLSMGTETTDLVVTNGFRVWQRSIPIGGNQFTKQLTKDLKLTFAKAEHLKRNARQAEDPKAIFQAMRPVFNDLVTEVQRSVNFFQSVDRKAKINGVLILGNAVKLPGLQQYLSKNLGYDVIDFNDFERLDSATIAATPAYKENIHGFAVSYGLCLQAMGHGALRTNLIPRELLFERMIRAKKPWAIGTLAALLLAFTFNFFFYYSAWAKVHEDLWKSGISDIQQVKSTSDGLIAEDSTRKKKKAFLEGIGTEVVGNTDRRILWLELLAVINQSLPTTPGLEPGVIPDPEDFPFHQRQELFIDRVESQYYEKLEDWCTEDVKAARGRAVLALQGDVDDATPAAGANPAGNPMAGNPAAKDPDPQGPGWVIEYRGRHYFNERRLTAGQKHVYDTLINFLENGSVKLANPQADGEIIEYSTKELGLSYAIITTQNEIDRDNTIANPNAVDTGQGGLGGFGSAGASFDDESGGLGGRSGSTTTPKEDVDDSDKEPESFKAPVYDFTVQVVWQETTLTKRLEARKKLMEEAAKKAAEEAAKNGAANGGQNPAPANPNAVAPVNPNAVAPVNPNAVAPANPNAVAPVNPADAANPNPADPNPVAPGADAPGANEALPAAIPGNG